MTLCTKDCVIRTSCVCTTVSLTCKTSQLQKKLEQYCIIESGAGATPVHNLCEFS